MIYEDISVQNISIIEVYWTGFLKKMFGYQQNNTNFYSILNYLKKN